MKQFKESGSVSKGVCPGHPRTLEENVEHIRQSCVRNPKKFIDHWSLAMGIVKIAIQNVLHKHLQLHAYKIQLIQIKANKLKLLFFMLSKSDDDESFLNLIIFTDEATFLVNGCINCHNWCIWRSQQPTKIHEYVFCYPKVNVWCGLLYDCIVWFFFFAEHRKHLSRF